MTQELIIKESGGYPVNAKGRRICGSAIAAKPGWFCESPFINQRNYRCKKHGGRTLYGTASPRFKTGLYSKYLPGRMLPSYKAVLAEESLSLRHEAALLGARITDLLGRTDTGESGKLWGRLQKACKDLVHARDAQDWVRVATLLTFLTDTVQKGAAEWQLWSDIVTLSMKKASLMASEHRMLVDAQQLMREDLVLAVIAGLMDAVSKVETDREKLAAIHAEWYRVLPPGLIADRSADAESMDVTE